MFEFRTTEPTSARTTAPPGGFGGARGPARKGAPIGVAIGCVLASLAISEPARALQPIATFLERADAQNPDNREALAIVAQRNAEAETAFRRLLPAFTARTTYSRNQYEVSFPSTTTAGETITLVPLNQIDAVFQLDVPIFDPAGYGRYRSQSAQASAAQASRTLTRLGVQQQIVSAYNQIVGTEALVASSKRSVEAAERNAATVKDRREAGLVPDFDVQRAAANVARARQDLADAELTASLSRRNLETLTGLAPLPSDAPKEDDLHEEASLDAWLGAPGASLPSGRVAAAQTRAAEVSRGAARLAFLPSVSAQAQERLSNAASFGGKNASYTLSATATWRFDLSLFSAVAAQDAAVAAARAREEKTSRGAEDAVFDSWQRVHAGIAKSRAARAQAAAAAQAARLAEERYASGAATQLEVIEAQRDAFSAEAQRVMADAALGASRLLLRINAGRSAAETAPRTP